MFIPLAEVLECDLLLRARPRVRAAAAQVAAARVRWVHSSEVVRIAPLLRGEELLLTGGQTLLGLKPGRQRRYVRDLAERGVSALAVETAASAHGLSADLLEEAENVGLPLIELQRVVPFVDVAEEVNRRIVSRQVSALQIADALSQRLAEHLAASGAAVMPLLARIAAALSAEVTLADHNGHVIGSAEAPGTGSGGAPETEDAPGASAAPVSTDILIGGVVVARLTMAGSPDPALLAVVGERISNIVALALSQRHAPTLEQVAEARLMGAVVHGTDLNRLRELGRSAGVPAQAPVTVVMFAGAGLAAAAGPLGRVLRRHAPGLRTALESDAMYALVPLDPARPQADRGRLVVALREVLAGTTVTGGIGPAVASFMLAPHSLQAVRSSRSLAQDAGSDGGLTDSEDYVVERLAVDHLGADAVDRLSQELIGSLLDYDQRRGTHLVETLEQWLRSGCNTAETARTLFLERQSMHSRLSRIFELIGGDPRGTPRMAGLHLATRLARHPAFAAPDRAAE